MTGSSRRDSLGGLAAGALLMAAAVVTLAAAPAWTPQVSGVSARLRGVSAVSDRIVWASGEKGTVLRTADGGATWQPLSIPGTASLDFRDIDAIGDRVAYALSIGPGNASRIYKTTDAGATWVMQFTNQDPAAFFDAMAFWDAERGVAFSDSVDGQFVILITSNGGQQWTRVALEGLPAALPGEGAFAASGTNVAVRDANTVWIGTTKGRVLRSLDAGRTWTVAPTGLATSATAGIFSIAFRDLTHGIVVGGDYKQERAVGDNAAVTSDGGQTWTTVGGLGGFRSAVAYLPGSTTSSLIAVGPSGADLSNDDGRSWAAIAGDGFHALSVDPRGRVAWGVGESGRIGRLRW